MPAPGDKLPGSSGETPTTTESEEEKVGMEMSNLILARPLRYVNILRVQLHISQEGEMGPLKGPPLCLRFFLAINICRGSEIYSVISRGKNGYQKTGDRQTVRYVNFRKSGVCEIGGQHHSSQPLSVMNMMFVIIQITMISKIRNL